MDRGDWLMDNDGRMNALFSKPVRVTALEVTLTLILLLSWTRMEEAPHTQATSAEDGIRATFSGQVATSIGELTAPW